MTPLEKIMAAIYGRKVDRIPVVIPYLQYYLPYIIDKISSFTWVDLFQGGVEEQRRAIIKAYSFFGCDWVRVWPNLSVLNSGKHQDKVDKPSKKFPGWGTTNPEKKLSIKEIEAKVEMFSPQTIPSRYELARKVADELGKKVFIYGRVRTPYSSLYNYFTIEDGLVALHDEPELCKKILDKSLEQQLKEIREWATTGVHGLWLGEWLASADIISERDYLEFVFPYEKVLIEAVRSAGLIDIFHFTGEVIPRMKYIRKLKPRVFGIEEPKKGYDLDIGRIRKEIGQEVCLLGNMDVMLVEKGSKDEWVFEIKRQIRDAGSKNFIVSCGSPITPDTSLARLKDFIEAVKFVGRSN